MSGKPPTLDQLRRYAIARSLFKPTTLPKAIERLGFVQADPIRAPARAQDLTLRQRVADYRAGDLERRYHRLPIEEDFFINYGFLPRAIQALMHPRQARTVWPKSRWTQAYAVLDFVRERGVVHPRDVDAAFNHGKVKNWFGGNSNASTQLLDGMHYRGLVRIARREGGVRLYAARDPHEAAPDPAAALDRLVDVVLNKYAPLPERSLSELVMREPGQQAPRRRRPAAAAGTVRPGGVGPPAFRGLLGLGLPLRGLHAGAATRARLLRAADVVAGPGAGLGQPGAARRCAAAAARFYRRQGAARCRFQACAGRRAGPHRVFPRAALMRRPKAAPVSISSQVAGSGTAAT
jgi:hypothetical protein